MRLFRVILGVLSIALAVHLLRREPWHIHAGDPDNAWAMVHCYMYGVLGCAVLIVPIRGLVAAMCLTSIPGMMLTYLLALNHWQPGNDGGGVYWITVVGPASFIASIAYGMAGVRMVPWKVCPGENASSTKHRTS